LGDAYCAEERKRKGSCVELETQITIAKELKYIAEDKKVELLKRLDHICRMTSNLIKKL